MEKKTLSGNFLITFSMSQHTMGGGTEKVVLYKYDHSKTVHTVLNAWHMITLSTPQWLSRRCYSYNFIFTMVNNLLLYSGPWFESWLHSFPWSHNKKVQRGFWKGSDHFLWYSWIIHVFQIK